MKRKIKKVLTLCSFLTFGAISTVGLASCQPETEETTYSISVDTNGVEIPSGEIVLKNSDGVPTNAGKPGEKITIDITYDDREIDTIKVNNQELTKNEDGKYVFTMPDKDAVINITFKEEVEPDPEPEPEPEPEEKTFKVTFDGGDVILASGDARVEDEDGAALNEIKAGSKVFVSFKEGLEVENITIDGVTITKEEDGRYSFTMPEKDVKVVIDWVDVYSITVNTNGETLEEGALKITDSSGKEVTSSKAGEEIKVVIEHTLPVKEVKMNDTTLEAEEDGSFIFTMPEEAVTLSIDWVKSGTLSIEADIDFSNFTMFDLTYLTGTTVNHVPESSIDLDAKIITLDYNVEYTLHLVTLANYTIASVSLDGSLLTSTDGYTFTFTSESKKLTIETDEVIIEEPEVTYGITFDAGDTGIDSSSVTFINFTNTDYENVGSEGDEIWVRFSITDENLIPEEVFFNETTCDVYNADMHIWKFIMPAEDVVVTAKLKEVSDNNILTLVNNSGGNFYFDSNYKDGLYEGPYQLDSSSYPIGGPVVANSTADFPLELKPGTTYTMYYSWFASASTSPSISASENVSLFNVAYSFGIGNFSFEYSGGPATITIDEI